MLDHGVEMELHDLDKARLSETELDNLIGDRDYKQFLNPRNETYRLKNMKEKPPTRAEAIRLMAKAPNLIRRPIAIRGAQIVLGFDEESLRKLMK